MIQFCKYQGAGNDFIMIDNRKDQVKSDKVKFAQKWCDRHFGIGSDGVIFIENWAEGDFLMDFYNPDGSQSFCGNGSRCAMAFAKMLGIVNDEAKFVAVDGAHKAKFDGDLVHIKMNDVREVFSIGQDLVINTGSPHYLQQCNNTKALDVVKQGQEIRNSEEYRSKGINVNFIEDIDSNTIRIRTYERGVEDETLACGTGATAAALSFAHRNSLQKGEVKVKAMGGDLKVKFEKNGAGYSNIWLIGPAVQVYQGTING